MEEDMIRVGIDQKKRKALRDTIGGTNMKRWRDWDAAHAWVVWNIKRKRNAETPLLEKQNI